MVSIYFQLIGNVIVKYAINSKYIKNGIDFTFKKIVTR